MLVRAQWVTFDNLEIARFKITAGIGECLDATYDFDDSTHTSGNDTVKNNHIHDWTIAAINSSAISHGTGSICQNGAAGPINAIGNTITDKNTTAATEIGACFRNLSRVQNNDCESVAEGEVGHFGPIDGNIIANLDRAGQQNLTGSNPHAS